MICSKTGHIYSRIQDCWTSCLGAYVLVAVSDLRNRSRDDNRGPQSPHSQRVCSVSDTHIFLYHVRSATTHLHRLPGYRVPVRDQRNSHRKNSGHNRSQLLRSRRDRSKWAKNTLGIPNAVLWYPVYSKLLLQPRTRDSRYPGTSICNHRGTI